MNLKCASIESSPLVHKARVFKMYLRWPPLLRPGFCRRGHKESTACNLSPGSAWQAYTSALSRRSPLSFPRMHSAYLEEYFGNSTIVDHNVITFGERSKGTVPNNITTFFGHGTLVISYFLEFFDIFGQLQYQSTKVLWYFSEIYSLFG